MSVEYRGKSDDIIQEKRDTKKPPQYTDPGARLGEKYSYHAVSEEEPVE